MFGTVNSLLKINVYIFVASDLVLLGLLFILASALTGNAYIVDIVNSHSSKLYSRYMDIWSRKCTGII